ncbi:MAG: peptidoglycan DD-metalloendopeptidase family protein [Pseudomonadota bacterium]
MLNLFPRTAYVLVALLPGLLSLPAFALDDAASKAQELKALQKALETARAEVGGLNAKRSEEVRALRELETRQGEAARALHEAREATAAQEARLGELRARRLELETSIARGRENLALNLKALYMLGADSGLQSMLSPGGRAEKMRLEGYLACVRERHVQALSGLRADLDESAQVEAELEQGMTHLITLEQSAREEQARLDGLRQKQTAEIDALEARVKAGEARVDRMRRDQRDLAALVRKLEEAMRAPPPAPPRSGSAAKERAESAASGRQKVTLQKPPSGVSGKGAIPVEGRLVRRFGEQTGLGELRSDGHFYAAAEGAPVRAAEDGRVVFADWMRGFGQLIILQHRGGYLSLYAHNEAIYKGLGVNVRRGEVISAAGRSGGARQTGLYFEVRRGGQPVNPARWSALNAD